MSIVNRDLSTWNYTLDLLSCAGSRAPDWEWRLAFVKRHAWRCGPLLDLKKEATTVRVPIEPAPLPVARVVCR